MLADPLIGSIVQDIFRELAENENCRQPLEDRLLPTIASILHSPDKVPVGMPSVGLEYVNSPKSQFDTTSCDKVCQWLAIDLWFSPGTPVSSSTGITEVGDFFALVSMKSSNFCQKMKF